MSNIAIEIHYRENKEFIDYINKCGGIVPTEQSKKIARILLPKIKIDKEQLKKNAKFLIPKLKWYQKILQKLHFKDYYKSYNKYMDMLEKLESEEKVDD